MQRFKRPGTGYGIEYRKWLRTATYIFSGLSSVMDSLCMSPMGSLASGSGRRKNSLSGHGLLGLAWHAMAGHVAIQY